MIPLLPPLVRLLLCLFTSQMHSERSMDRDHVFGLTITMPHLTLTSEIGLDFLSFVLDVHIGSIIYLILPG
jgi:hypothetical protein